MDIDDTIIIHHISFKDIKILTQELMDSDTIFLIPRPYHLKEIEIFVENITFTNVVKEEYTNSRAMPRESRYTTEFWKNCDCGFYYQPNAKIFEVMEIR